MYILLNDILQYADIADELKSPMLSDKTSIQSSLFISLDKTREVNAIGIGNCNCTYFKIILDNSMEFTYEFKGNGLYLLNKTYNINYFTLITDGSFIGRIGAGIGCNIPTSIAKEPTFNSTAESRVTLSGQVIPGIGGYTYKSVSLDSRYKINESMMNEIKNGYKFIAMDYPFFIDLSIESYKLPFSKLYAIDKNQKQLSFESGIKKYLYSRRWEFEERF